jgi:hypothetical protein
VLSARAHLGSLPSPVLLQRPQLAGRLRREKIVFTQQDNAIVAVEDFARAQELADDLDPLILHKRRGTRLRHSLGNASIKMYDKFRPVLRIETTTHDVSFFKHYRKAVHRDGRAEMKHAPIQKIIHSLGAVREVLAAANRRYLEFLSVLEDDSSGRRDLDRVSRSVQDDAGRSYRGINFFLPADLDLALAIVRGEHLISGVTARKLRKRLPLWTSSQVSRAIRRLRELGLLRKIGGTFKYYIAKLGQKVITAAMHVRENTIIPSMAFPIHA